MRTRTLFLMLLAVSLAGCGMSAARRYQTGALLYTGTADGLAALKEAGKLDVDEIEKIEVAIDHGALYLEQWQQALDANEPYVSAEESFDMVIKALLVYYALPAERISEEVSP